MVATAPGEKLLIGRYPVRNWTHRMISRLFLCRKLHLFLGKPTNSRKLLPPELHFSTPICITSFVGWQQFLTVCWFFAKNKCNFLHKNNDEGRVVYITCRLYTPDPPTVLTGIGADFRFEVPRQSSLGLIGGGRGQRLGGTMASAEHEPIMESGGRAPSGVQGQSPWSGGQKAFWSLDVQRSRQI